NRKAKAHVFDGSAEDAIEPVMLTGEVTRVQQEFGFFESTAAVVARIMALAHRIEPGMRILEPSAGRGAIAVPLMKAGAEVHTWEILPKNAETLRAAGLRHVHVGDFLASDPVPGFYHQVLMNPPFGRRADVDHVLHAARSLRSGGTLVSVMSAGVTFRQDRKTLSFHDQVRRMSLGVHVEPLPPLSFRESGTDVNAVLIAFTLVAQ